MAGNCNILEPESSISRNNSDVVFVALYRYVRKESLTPKAEGFSA